MAVLSTSDRERLAWVVQYIERSGGGRYFDTKAADELAKIFGGICGFRCVCGNFQQALKAAPYATLLKVLLCNDEGLVVLAQEGADAASCGTTTSAAPISLQQLIDTGGSITIGNLVFAAFGLISDLALITPSDIFVETVLSEGCVGLRFSGDMVTTGTPLDFVLEYSVETTSGLPLLSSIGQSFLLSATANGGNVLIGETVFDQGFFIGNTIAQSSIGFEDVIDPPGESVQGDDLIISPPLSKVWVTKDLLLIPADTQSSVGLAQVCQFFC